MGLRKKSPGLARRCLLLGVLRRQNATSTARNLQPVAVVAGFASTWEERRQVTTCAHSCINRIQHAELPQLL